MNPDKIRNVLNILFMVLALAAIIIYFAAKDDFKLFIYVCGAAIFVKLMEFSYGSPTDRRSDYDKRRYYKARESGCQETDSDERQSHALLPGMQSRRSS